MSSPASEHLDHAPGGTEAGQKTRWQFLGQRNNRQVLSWLAVGLTVFVVGGWTVFAYLGELEPPKHAVIDQVQVPEWVPVYPGAKLDGLSSTAGRGRRLNGGFFFILPEDYDAALKFYKTNLELRKWNVKIDSKPGAYSGGTLSATSEDGKKSIVVTSGTVGVSSRKYLVAFEKSGN
jgi:hypothetical protein